MAAGLQEFYFVRESSIGKHANSFLVGGFRTTEGHVHVNDFLHAYLNLFYVIIGQRTAIFLFEVTIVAPAE